MRLLVFLCTLILFVSCASHVPQPCPVGLSTLSWTADTSFTEAERAGIERAMVDWLRFSEGRVNHTVMYSSQSDPFGARIVRLESWMPKVKEQERRQAERFDKESFTLWGWQQDWPMRIFIVADRLSPDVFPAVVAHELGHAVGLRRPNCEEPEDCAHLTDKGALMYTAPSARTFTESDREMCRASCLCP